MRMLALTRRVRLSSSAADVLAHGPRFVLASNLTPSPGDCVKSISFIILTSSTFYSANDWAPKPPAPHLSWDAGMTAGRDSKHLQNLTRAHLIISHLREVACPRNKKTSAVRSFSHQLDASKGDRLLQLTRWIRDYGCSRRNNTLPTAYSAMNTVMLVSCATQPRNTGRQILEGKPAKNVDQR